MLNEWVHFLLCWFVVLVCNQTEVNVNNLQVVRLVNDVLAYNVYTHTWSFTQFRGWRRVFRSCCTRVKEKPCTLNGWGLHVYDSVQVCFKHFLCRHLFFFRPGPPNLGMSRHVLHVPQFSFVQPVHLQFDPFQLCTIVKCITHVQYIYIMYNVQLYMSIP